MPRENTLLAAAKRLYSQYTANHPTIHCNRFPAWDELPKDEQNKWLRAALADAATGASSTTGGGEKTDARGVREDGNG